MHYFSGKSGTEALYDSIENLSTMRDIRQSSVRLTFRKKDGVYLRLGCTALQPTVLHSRQNVAARTRATDRNFILRKPSVAQMTRFILPYSRRATIGQVCAAQKRVIGRYLSHTVRPTKPRWRSCPFSGLPLTSERLSGKAEYNVDLEMRTFVSFARLTTVPDKHCH